MDLTGVLYSVLDTILDFIFLMSFLYGKKKELFSKRKIINTL